MGSCDEDQIVRVSDDSVGGGGSCVYTYILISALPSAAEANMCVAMKSMCILIEVLCTI